MAVALVGAGRGAKQRDRLALRHHLRQFFDVAARLRVLHLFEEATPVLLPGDRRAVRAVVVGGQPPAPREFGTPGVPGFVRLRHAARPVPADEQAEAIVLPLRVVPAFGLQWHDAPAASAATSDWRRNPSPPTPSP